MKRFAQRFFERSEESISLLLLLSPMFLVNIYFWTFLVGYRLEKGSELTSHPTMSGFTSGVYAIILTFPLTVVHHYVLKYLVKRGFVIFVCRYFVERKRPNEQKKLDCRDTCVPNGYFCCMRKFIERVKELPRQFLLLLTLTNYPNENNWS